MSWRIPLGIQLIPGLILAVGTLFLPPSPRLMVLHGRHEDAERSLTMLRGRNGAQGGLIKVGILLSLLSRSLRFFCRSPFTPANSCCFAQVELLEMQVETILVQRVDGDRTTKGVFDELRAWKRLFGRKYRDRTMVGVLIMVFQRTLSCCSLLFLLDRCGVVCMCVSDDCWSYWCSRVTTVQAMTLIWFITFNAFYRFLRP